jgi:hypothetical protein
MRKLVFMLIAVLCLSMTAIADQLEFVSEQDAQNAVKLLKKQKYVLLYCGCCADGYDAKQYVKLKSVSYRYTNYMDFYEVVVNGVDANGNMVSETIDLAYSHIKKGKNALCIGRALNLECDPCVENLKWECPKF